jgi:hypothetical protein
MLIISNQVLKSLYASHGGLCAFPDCPYPARVQDGTPLLEVVHIHASTSGGPRGNPTLSFTDANDESNLILLCPAHHAMIDKMPSEYPATRVIEIRRNHTSRVAAILSSANGTLTADRPAINRIEWALNEWHRERSNNSEEFWQRMFDGHPELLSAAAHGRAFKLGAKCYVGGKAITNRGGNVLDFLAQHHGDVVLIEIKTPSARLLGPEYRSVYPPSHELSGAVTQALNYRLSLLNDLYVLQAHSPNLRVHFPSIFVLIGDAEREDMSEAQRRSFELFRSSLKDVMIQTYDELFAGVANLAVWMEPSLYWHLPPGHDRANSVIAQPTPLRRRISARGRRGPATQIAN